MTSHDIERIERLFQEAADLAADQREAFLTRCGASSGEVERLRRMLARLDAGESLAPPVPENQEREGPGTVIERYKLLQKIGEGGYGVVYMAEQLEPVRRRVALKVIKLGMDTREVVARFEAERQALALMDHPGIAKVLDGGATAEGRPYFVMELVRGVSITEYCDEERLRTDERLQLFRQVCLAVHHAHQKGVIHRDIKPSNVMVTLHDGVPVPKVIDFGIAKAMHTRLTEKTLFTEYQRFIGTPAYMSPEQAEMSAIDIDTRSDVYSLGVLLYELLTGTTPFDVSALMRRGLSEIQRVIREEEPERPSNRVSTTADAAIGVSRGAAPTELARGLRGDLDWIVMKALEKDRTRRYGSTSELADDVLRHLESDPVSAGPPSRGYRLKKLLVKNRGAVAFSAAILLALVAGVIGTGLSLVEASHQRDEARREAQAAREVTDFLVDTLALADPEIALQPALSMREVLRRSARRVDDELAAQPKAEARVRIAMGRAYESLGEPEPAEVQLRRAVALIDEHGGVDPVEHYGALWRLTHVLFTLERPDALTTAQAARRVALDHVGSRFPELAQSLRAFVRGVDEAAHSSAPDGAEGVARLFDETVRLSEERLPAGDELWPLVAETYEHAAYDVWYSPHERISIPFWERALEIHRRVLPAGHPLLGSTLNQLTGVLNRAGSAEAAEAHVRESVALVESAFPEDSFRVALSRAGLGENLSLQGRYAEAEPHLLAAHAVVLATTEDVTFYAAHSSSRLIDLYAGWNRETEAQRYRDEFVRIAARTAFLQPYDIGRRYFGPREERLLAALDAVHAACGDLTFPVAEGTRSAPELVELAEKVVRERRAVLQDEHPLSIEVGRYLLHFAGALDPDREAEARERLVEEARSVLGGLLEFAPLEVAEAAAQAADVARRQGDLEIARARVVEARAALEHARAKDAWFGAASRVRIARAFVRLEAYRAAEELLLPAYRTFLDELGVDHGKSATLRALAREMYLSWGKPEEAARFADPESTR